MFSFLVLGSWGAGSPAGRRAVAGGLARAAERYDAQMVVSTGDNVSAQGVSGVRDPNWHDRFDAVYDAPSLHLPWYPALGDGDHAGDVAAQVEFSQYDVRWHLPNRYYSINKRVNATTHVQFVVLDTTPFADAYPAPGASSGSTRSWAARGAAEGTAYDPRLQCYWLRHMLAPSRSAWRIVVGHHPIRSGSHHRGDTPALRDTVLPVLQSFGVQAYFCGHPHDLQHLTEDGLHHVVSGAGSATAPTDACALTNFCRAEPGFAAVTLEAERMTLRFCDAEGEALYTAEIPRTPRPARTAA